MLFSTQLSKQYIKFLGMLNMAAVPGIDFVNSALINLNLRVTICKSKGVWGKLNKFLKWSPCFFLISLNFMRQFLLNLGVNCPL